jgi:hypothetical protein
MTGGAEPSDPHPFLADLWFGPSTPHELLRSLVDVLHSTRSIDRQLCGRIGAGNLESLLRDHEEELWLDVERLARSDDRFRCALQTVVAANSSMFLERCDLLDELAASSARRTKEQRSKRPRRR